MSDAESSPVSWVRPADRQILEFLADRRADYPALIASRIGVHVPYVERRCEALADGGLLEAVTEEVVYRITDAGCEFLTAQPNAPAN